MAVKNLVGDNYTDEGIKNLETQIGQIRDQLQNFNTSAATDEELRKRAESEYTPIYNAQVAEQQAAKQTAQSTLEGSLSALERQYARDSEELGRAYDRQAVSANNQMLARGFNNSSLAAAMANYVNTERNRALSNLAAERTAAETSAQAAYNNAVTAADAAIGRLGSDLATNIDARLQALRDTEQSRVFQQMQAQNALKQYEMDLMLQLEQLRRQAQNNYYSMYGTGSSGGSGSKSSSSGSTAASTQPSSSLADMFNKSNTGSSTGVASNMLNALSGAVNKTGKNDISSNTTGLNRKKIQTTPNGSNYIK